MKRYIVATIVCMAMHPALAQHTAETCWDPDGDGWGWNGWASCRVTDANRLSSEPTSNSDLPCIQTTADGWGWNGWASCRVDDAVNETGSGTAVVSSSQNQGTEETGNAEQAQNILPENSSSSVGNNSFPLNTPFGGEETLDVVTGDIFAIWWDPRFDHSSYAQRMLQDMTAIANRLRSFGFEDPPNAANGSYFNTYLHNATDDLFPNDWDRGIFSDESNLPYMILRQPYGRNLRDLNRYMSHAWQQQSNGTGFTDHQDSQWFYKAFAWWNAAHALKDEPNAFWFFDVPRHLPYVSLWRTDSRDWMHHHHQYGVASFLYYLSEVGNVDRNVIAGGYASRTHLTPQQWLSEQIGAQRMRDLFVDWATGNTADLAYISEAAAAVAHATTIPYPELCKLYAEVMFKGAAAGVHQPTVDFIPEAWSYNVMRIYDNGRTGDTAGRYDIAFDGDSVGTNGTDARFQIQLVVNEHVISKVSMSSATTASFSVDSGADVQTIDIVIVSVPDSFTGLERFPYSVSVQEN